MISMITNANNFVVLFVNNDRMKGIITQYTISENTVSSAIVVI